MVRAVEVYDPSTDRWEKRKDSPFVDLLVWNAVTVGNRIYLIGSDRFYAYDPITDRFEANRPRPGGFRTGFSMAAAEGRIYSFGGSGTSVNAFDVYDPVRNDWSVLPAGPKRSRVYAGMAAIGRKVYVLGGSFNSFQFRDDSVYEYDPGAAESITLSRTEEQFILTWAQVRLESATEIGSSWTPDSEPANLQVLQPSGDQSSSACPSKY